MVTISEVEISPTTKTHKKQKTKRKIILQLVLNYQK